jgi:hypothetical protein
LSTADEVDDLPADGRPAGELTRAAERGATTARR